MRLVIPDAHAAIRTAVQARLPGAAFRACRIHPAGNIARRAGSRRRQQLAIAAFAPICHQADRGMAVTQYHWFATAMERVSQRPCACIGDREVDLTARAGFPPAHPAQDLVDQSPRAPDGRDRAPQPGPCSPSPVTDPPGA